MEKVVYFLGAGFSAPLGLPVISEFYDKSKDIYQEDKNKYKSFEKIFKYIKDLSFIKNYYHTDLTNIEEILSILEINNNINNTDFHDDFVDYIVRVLTYCAPLINKNLNLENSPVWIQHLFGYESQNNINLYGKFVSSILNISYKIEKDSYDASIKRIIALKKKHPVVKYSIITLNYDTVFEQYVEYISQYYGIAINTNNNANEDFEEPCTLRIAKLHGCIREKNIIPPTSFKRIWDGPIHEAWEFAYKLLSEANHIRFVGYSLPVNDLYIRYFLKAALINNPVDNNLKSIDIICRDPNGDVYQRYHDLICFKKMRFKDSNFLSFVQHFDSIHSDSYKSNMTSISWDKLEGSHETYMSMGSK